MSEGHCTFYLGSHQTEWAERTDVPLFLSARRLRTRRALVAPRRGDLR